jgi:hypothetical protein
MIPKKYIDALVASKFDLIKSNELFKNDLANLKFAIKSDLESLASLAEPEVCLARSNFFKLEGITTFDYRERILELDDEKFIMAGIRFHGLDVMKPFVSVDCSFKFLNEETITKISNLVWKDFSMFRPLSFHLTLPSNFQINLPTVNIDQYTVIGVVEDLICSQLSEIPHNIELLELTSMEFFNEYLKEYELFHQRNPTLRYIVKPESVEDFQESILDKLLYKIIINGTSAGLIAGLARDFYGIKGVNILEEILFDSFVGKGFGVYIQRAFTLKLKNRYSILWGTISSLNIPSLKTALKNGRQVREIEFVFSMKSRYF